MSTIKNADNIYVLGVDGKVVESGTHTDLLSRDGDYARMWRNKDETVERPAESVADDEQAVEEER